jgi:ribonuclease HIII
MIRKTKGVVVQTTYAGMDRYNEMMGRPRANLNNLLAWMHAASVRGALEKRRVDWGMLDQFSKQPLTQKELKKAGETEFDLRMMTKAEADPVVAAASVIASATFTRELGKLGREYGEPLKKGAGAPAKAQGVQLVEKLGPEALGRFAKMHFKTSYEILGKPVPQKPAYFAKRSGS